MRRLMSTSAGNAAALRVAVVLERRPVIYLVEPWQAEFDEWQAKNRASQMGRQDPLSRLTLQNKTVGKGGGGGGGAGAGSDAGGSAGSQYAVKKKKLDLLAEFNALKKYNETDADRAKDTKSLLRALSRRLYLVVQDEKTGAWEFPTVDLGDSPTLRAAAERAATEALQPLEPFLFGNCPVGHLEAKTFFYMGEVVWDQGMRLPNPARMALRRPWQWLTREELFEVLPAPAYVEVTKKMLTHT
jgi:hypothetical protein